MSDMPKFPKTLVEAIRYFADLDTAREFLASRRWPNGVVCPHCKSEKVGFIATRKIYKCKQCRKQFSVKTGTIFEDSPLSLDKWLTAMWLIANSRNGISSYEISRNIDVEQRTAWFMLHRIRAAMASGSLERLSGEFEADESFFGGEPKFMHKDARRKRGIAADQSIKKPVMGIGRRNEDGKGLAVVRAWVVKDTTMLTMVPKIIRNVEFGSRIDTDCNSAYGPLGQVYNHKTVNHSACYADGDVTTNRIENFWSVLKRGLKGTYIRPNEQHLNRYVQEAVFRANVKDEADSDRFAKLVDSVSGKRLTYKNLTKKS